MVLKQQRADTTNAQDRYYNLSRSGGWPSCAGTHGGIVGVLVLDGAHNALGAPVYLVHQLILGIHVAADANLLGSPAQA